MGFFQLQHDAWLYIRSYMAPCWESKCGSLARIQHCLNELNGPAYGHVIAYYAYKLIVKWPFYPKYLRDYMKKVRDFYGWKRLLRNIKPIPRAWWRIWSCFQSMEATWFTGEMAFTLIPTSGSKQKEFGRLEKLGKDILPLLAKRMDESTSWRCRLWKNCSQQKAYYPYWFQKANRYWKVNRDGLPHSERITWQTWSNCLTVRIIPGSAWLRAGLIRVLIK